MTIKLTAATCTNRLFRPTSELYVQWQGANKHVQLTTHRRRDSTVERSRVSVVRCVLNSQRRLPMYLVKIENWTCWVELGCVGRGVRTHTSALGSHDL